MGAMPGTLRAPGVTFLEWPGAESAVVLALEDSLLVAAHAEALSALRALSSTLLLDDAGVRTALGPWHPRLIGTAQLAYVDAQTFAPAAASSRAHRAEMRDVEKVLSLCTVDERDESGLPQMDSWFTVDREDVPAAAAGFESWGADVGHVGVAVGPAHRHEGLGAMVASAASSDALREHQVVQWRSRTSNTSSVRLGRRLGCVPMGVQLAFELHGDPIVAGGS